MAFLLPSSHSRTPRAASSFQASSLSKASSAEARRRSNDSSSSAVAFRSSRNSSLRRKNTVYSHQRLNKWWYCAQSYVVKQTETKALGLEQIRNQGDNRAIIPPKFSKTCVAVRCNMLQSFCPPPPKTVQQQAAIISPQKKTSAGCGPNPKFYFRTCRPLATGGGIRGQCPQNLLCPDKYTIKLKSCPHKNLFCTPKPHKLTLGLRTCWTG